MREAGTLVEVLVEGLLKLRNRHFLVIDAVALLVTPAVALVLRLESTAALQQYAGSLAIVTATFLVIKVAIFRQTGLYNRYWKYASIDELAKIILAVVGGVAVGTGVFFLVLRPLGWVSPSFPRSLPFIDALLTVLCVGGARYSVRLAHSLQVRAQPNGHSRRVLVIGAGDAGITMVQEMRNNPQLGLHPVAFVDDDPEKHGVRIRGLDVLGSHQDISTFVREKDADLIIIAIARASGKVVRDIMEVCRQTGVEVKTVPGVYELLDDKVSVSHLRSVQVEDLLRREPVRAGWGKVEQLLHGKSVLVTGAGGSIGSELCRHIITLKPAELILLGHGENSIFRIEAELRRRIRSPQEETPLRIRSVIADIRDRHRMEHIFGLFKPEIVFHAAAHKHVPLMEANVEDAVTNNVGGTRALLDLAVRANVERFILISTDKAVNPTNMMGATKRIAERLLHDVVADTDRAFLAVRFGNVLGSRGSVLEVFRDQLARGGPLTVTHPDVERYFMTIPEAAHLVLQAAALGGGGEIFVLDMGEPIHIVDLARELIRLSGMKAGHDIDIVFTGLRPGEKMHEQLFSDDEPFAYTEHKKILMCSRNENPSAQSKAERERLRWGVGRLLEAARRGDRDEIYRLIHHLVPTFKAEEAALSSGRVTPRVPISIGSGDA